MERMRMRARQERALRGTAAAAVASITAAAAHTLAGGGAPAWWLVLVTTLLASPLAVAIIGRAPTRIGTAAVVVLAQGLLHVAFAAVGTDAPHAALGHHASTGSVALALGSGGHVHLTAGMAAAHLVAAAATVVLLSHGERLVRAIARGLRRLLSTARPSLPRVHAVPQAAHAVRLPSVALFLSALSRRGPPALAL